MYPTIWETITRTKSFSYVQIILKVAHDLLLKFVRRRETGLVTRGSRSWTNLVVLVRHFSCLLASCRWRAGGWMVEDPIEDARCENSES